MSAQLGDDLDEDDLNNGVADQPKNFYPTVFAFVAGFVADIYAHEVSDQQTSWRWCAQWHHHPEAIARLEAAWKAWEALRLDPGTGAGTWFRDFGDPCMTALTAPEGPFARCSDTSHRTPPRLPLSTNTLIFGAAPLICDPHWEAGQVGAEGNSIGLSEALGKEPETFLGGPTLPGPPPDRCRALSWTVDVSRLA